MTQTVRITEIVAPEPGTRKPWRFKDGNGTVYASFDAALGRLVQQHKDEPLTIAFEVQTKNGYTNNILKSAIVPQAAPAATTGGQPQGGGRTWQPRSPDEERRIVKQSVLKAAVELTASIISKGRELSDEEEASLPDTTLALAEKFLVWVYQTGAKNSGKVDEAVVQSLFPGAQTVGPRSRAV